MEFGLVGLKAL